MYGYDPQTLTSDIIDWQAYRDGVGTSALSGNTITLSGLSPTLQESRHRYASFYANASYSYLSRYNVSGSIRWDQADLFGLDIRNQRHPLWSVLDYVGRVIYERYCLARLPESTYDLWYQR
jgi:hypothetical protein